MIFNLMNYHKDLCFLIVSLLLTFEIFLGLFHFFLPLALSPIILLLLYMSPGADSFFLLLKLTVLGMKIILSSKLSWRVFTGFLLFSGEFT